ncbi:MAG TPA: CbiX/SirB N-terminal domain-containing protein [Burkholderiales bacterium]|nr:CbiX/SirB N-terminal domain-containing protein [Burkholderiales bacterium]
MSAKHAIVLLAHGSRDAQWAQPFERLAALLAKHSSCPVRLAYLELMRPALPEALDALAHEGASAIRVVPVFLGAGGHVKQDLPRLVQEARERHPRLRVEIDAPIGEQDAVLAAIAAAISSPARRGP